MVYCERIMRARDMNYCTKCVQPDTRPGIQLNASGVCPACEYTEDLKSVDWGSRDKELATIVEHSQKNNHSGYDCIVGVSGGKDSTRQALFVRDSLKLKPLLISCTYPPEQQSDRGARNLSNLVGLGFDAITISPDPQTWKKLVRKGFMGEGNGKKSTETALYESLPRFSIAYHVPLIFLGENPATQMGDLAMGSLDWNANNMRNQNTIAGGADMYIDGETTKQHIIPYRYPPDVETQWAGTQLVFLGYFWRNFTKVDNADFSISFGLDIRTDTPAGRGALHPFEALDEDFVFVNQMIKYFKFGFGKVTDEVCELIRYGHMTREEGFKLVRKYDGKCSSEYIRRFCSYIDITEEKFWKVAESYRNKDIFEQDSAGAWRLKTMAV